MKPAPSNFPRLSSVAFYDDAGAAIDWLCRAFGFEVRIRIDGPDGGILHSELTYGEAVLMVATAGGEKPWPTSPQRAGGCTQAMALYVDDVDTHCQRAEAAGAVIATRPADSDHGPGYWADRSYECVDVGGHHWWFMQRLRDNPA